MKLFTLDNICLYRITHIDNLKHILCNGIVHRKSANFDTKFVAIGDHSLIDFRSSKKVTVNNSTQIILGDYIPFYFGVRMPMLYVIQHGGNFVQQARKPEEIIYVAVSLRKIIDGGYTYYFSDGHATDLLSKFYDKTQIEQLPNIIDWKAVTASNWAGDGIPTDLKRRKQAEFLIKEDISTDSIHGYVCYNENTKAKLMELGISETLIKIHPQSYY